MAAKALHGVPEENALLIEPCALARVVAFGGHVGSGDVVFGRAGHLPRQRLLLCKDATALSLADGLLDLQDARDLVIRRCVVCADAWRVVVRIDAARECKAISLTAVCRRWCRMAKFLKSRLIWCCPGVLRLQAASRLCVAI
eukprot:2451748-Pleurochrysis_carterae.AAC.3